MGDLDINMRILQIPFVFNNDLKLKMGQISLIIPDWVTSFYIKPFFSKKRKLKLNEYCYNISFHSGNEKFLIWKRKVFNMNISILLSTRERERILNEVLFKQDHISVVDVSRSLNVSKGFVSRFFSLLSKEKILKKSKKKYVVLDNLKVRC